MAFTYRRDVEGREPLARIADKLAKNGMRYVTHVPETIPKGLRLVHNFEPGSPKRRLGAGGFRAWWERTDDKRKQRRFLCRCGWAPQLKRHYDSDAVQLLKHKAKARA